MKILCEAGPTLSPYGRYSTQQLRKVSQGSNTMAVTTIGLVFALVVASAAGARVRRWPQMAGSFASAGSGFPSGFFYPQQPFFGNPNDAFQQWMQQMQQAQAFHNQQISGFSNNISPNGEFATSSVSFGPDGGFGEAAIGPNGGRDGLGVRISEDFGPPQGSAQNNQFGTFSSSSISTSVDSNGKQITRKQSAIGVNDNGKIYFKKTESP